MLILVLGTLMAGVAGFAASWFLVSRLPDGVSGFGKRLAFVMLGLLITGALALPYVLTLWPPIEVSGL